MSRKAYFNHAAETWDQKFYTSELETFLMKFVKKFDLKRGQHVLDVGTGTGILIPFLLQIIGESGSIFAIDYAEKMVEKCKLKYSHIKNVEIKLLDVEKDKLPSESFDAVTCFGLFPHLEHKEKALKNIYQAMKPEGHLIIAHALSSKEIKTHHQKAASPILSDKLPEKVEMTRLLKSVGFNKIHVEDGQGSYLCSSTKITLPNTNNGELRK